MASEDKIRTLKSEDIKTARFLIGSSLMTPLAVANNKACTHPLTLAVWLALSSSMIQLLNWWPTTTGPAGMLGLLTPIPAFGAIAVPIMFLFDWLQRPPFEKALREALVAQDMQEPHVHYSRCPASGFYILEHTKPIGLIALDASPESSDNPSANKRSSKTNTKTSAETAVIRHFHLEELYRTSGVQSDLLEHAISRAFSSSLSSRPRRVVAVASELDSYKTVALRRAGFRPTSDVGALGKPEWKVGAYGWKNQWLAITEEEWRARQ